VKQKCENDQRYVAVQWIDWSPNTSNLCK